MDPIKKALGERAAELIQNGMLVGLGSGTTAAFFIARLSERCKKEKLSIQAVASSQASADLAKKGGIPLLDIHTISHLDITVDGADEVDAQKRMIKGAGAAFVREKIVASMSREMVVIIEESKLVTQLGSRPLPVEILPFGRASTLNQIEKKGYKGTWRKTKEGKLLVTDNGNNIFDIEFDTPRSYPEEDEETLLTIPGIVDTGFFFNLAGRVMIGFSDGQIVTRN